MDSDRVLSRHYPIPITSLGEAKALKHNTIIGFFFTSVFVYHCSWNFSVLDLDCIIKDSRGEVIIFSHSEKSKKEVLVYDSSCLPGETVSLFVFLFRWFVINFSPFFLFSLFSTSRMVMFCSLKIWMVVMFTVFN